MNQGDITESTLLVNKSLRSYKALSIRGFVGILLMSFANCAPTIRFSNSHYECSRVNGCSIILITVAASALTIIVFPVLH